MSRVPYMPFYVGDYMADTAHLSHLENSAYLLLIFSYWQRGSLPTEPAKLARIARVTDAEWTEIEPTIAAFFDADWKHKRIEAELAKAKVRALKASNAGKASAERKLHSESTPSAPQAELAPNHPNPNQVSGDSSLPQEQETAREEVKAKKFDLGGVGVGLGGDPSVEARRAVARDLNIGDPTPILEAYRRWGGSRSAKLPDAKFRSFAKTNFARLTPEQRAACQPLAVPEPAIPKSTARPSPQLAALLAKGNRHAH